MGLKKLYKCFCRENKVYLVPQAQMDLPDLWWVEITCIAMPHIMCDWIWQLTFSHRAHLAYLVWKETLVSKEKRWATSGTNLVIAELFFPFIFLFSTDHQILTPLIGTCLIKCCFDYMCLCCSVCSGPSRSYWFNWTTRWTGRERWQRPSWSFRISWSQRRQCE